MWPHTPGAVGRHLLGFGAFLKGTSVMVMKLERALYNKKRIESYCDRG